MRLAISHLTADSSKAQMEIVNYTCAATLGMWKLESCLPGQIFQVSEKRCVAARLTSQISSKLFVQAPPGSTCSNNEICSGGSFCILPMKICLCPDDTENFGGQCRPPGAPIFTLKDSVGANCNDSMSCPNGSVCILGQCRCPIPLIQEGNQCIQKLKTSEVGPGELCSTSQICSRGSVCHPVIPVCICPENSVLMGNSCLSSALVRSNSIMSMWTPPQDMLAGKEFSVASKLNFEFGGAGQASVGFPCRANTECIIGAFCKANVIPATCQCLSTHVNINGFCEKVIYPGRNGCRHDIQCSVAYRTAKCFDGRCICPNGFSAIEQICEPDNKEKYMPPGGSCMTDMDCAGGSKCQNNWCICPETLMTVINENCKKITSQAYKNLLLPVTRNNFSTINEVTNDNDPYLMSSPLSSTSSTSERTSDITYGLEFECENDTQCNQDHICIIRQCKCKSGLIEKNGICIQLNAFEIPTDSPSATTISLQYIKVVTPTDSFGQRETTTVASPIGSATSPTSIPIRLPGQPRITGPPLRRPRFQTTISYKRSTYKTQLENGICPGGSYPIRDEITNYLIICNGEKPLCPPNSYCYVTGYANQEYNCCKA
uniref:EGF-like domain-containing protein n=1 Tax=Setaria digitata TaxID=48799 RepID=A0A915PLY9_9BILA